MPQQSLWAPRHPTHKSSFAVGLKRLFVFAATAAITAWAAFQMYQVLDIGGLTLPELLVLALFVPLFAWIALSFVTNIVGFAVLLGGDRRPLGMDPSQPLPTISTRTALVLPTYNEEPHRVMARLQAIYESLRDTGQSARFDLFVLSDTTDPAIWIAEEAAFLQLRERLQSEALFYRHRSANTGRKAGNIAEWVTRFGGRYDHMVVLDADSLMTGDTIVRLTAAMERHPDVALIQTLPVLLNSNTLFARLQQFAGRTYGPVIAHGFAWWHGAESNYCGHNAIIRVKAFAEQAGLPLLGGRKPFGGHILSHDFVEAALLRRAGWGVHLAPNLGGSYEECPPTLTDYAARDRRWCQGNLQHVAVLPARGLHWMSRVHLLTGIGCYITAPLWLLFLLLGIMISLQAQFIRPEYFPSGASLFPQWPEQDPIRSAYVFGGTMALLLVPKLIGYLAALARGRTRRGMGGFFYGLISVVFETIASALIAPIMMLMQSKAVLEILSGRDSGWQVQRRDDGTVSRSELAQQYALPTALGATLGLGAYVVSGPLLLWMLPVVAGLIMAIPVADLTSRSALGRRLRAAGLLLTPEERFPPDILLRANALTQECGPFVRQNPIALLMRDPVLLKAHFETLSVPCRRRGEINVNLVVALAKMEDAENIGELCEALSANETFAVLASRSALERLMTDFDPSPAVAEWDKRNSDTGKAMIGAIEWL